VRFSVERLRRQTKVTISLKMLKIQCRRTNVRYCPSTMDKYCAEEQRYLWYCGTKKYRQGDGTGTVEKWYSGAAVVPWYRATLVGRWTCDQEVAGSTPGWRIVQQQLWASCSHPCASVGASSLVGEYRTRNFHVAGANLALAICKQPWASC